MSFQSTLSPGHWIFCLVLDNKVGIKITIMEMDWKKKIFNTLPVVSVL
jgi:hypothetical protein